MMRRKGANWVTGWIVAIASAGYIGISSHQRHLNIASWHLSAGRNILSERTGSLFVDPNSRPTHSTILCQMDDTESEFDRRCHLQNVCWDRHESTFVYYLDADRMNETSRGTVLPNGKPRRISVRRHIEDSGYAHDYLPLVDRAGPIPLANATFSDHSVHIYFTSFYAGNFGHALNDDIHPLFAIMHAFRMTTRDSVFLYPREVADNLWDSHMKERGSKFLHELANLLSLHGILRMDTHPEYSPVASNHSGPHLVCMSHLLAGTGNLENLNAPPNINLVGSWPEFMDAILTGWRREVGIMTEEQFPPPIEAQLIVFISKTGRRRFVNLDTLVETIEKRTGVEALVINPGEMTIIEQISIAQRATVTFSPCGGISFFNAFLREGATAIIGDYWDPDRKASASMEGYLWDRVFGHQTLRYMVQENEITIEAPGNATAKEWKDYRDWGATMLDVDRAIHLIEHALYMAEHTFHLARHESSIK